MKEGKNTNKQNKTRVIGGLLWTFGERILKDHRFVNIAKISIGVSFCFSFAIEAAQLIFRVGTWQLSDLFYNTLGGFIGGLIYWIGFRIKHKK